nr:PcfJ domain-containing protein [Acutalibacter sp. 1XD8-36]
MDSYTLHTLSETTQYNSLGRVLRYLNKQYAQAAGALKKRKKDYFVTLYRDYLNCASELKSDMKKRGVLEPKDLKFQHDLLTARVNEQKEEERQKELNKPIDQSVYWWAQAYANQDFTVVYPQKRLDFLTEGQCLNHCVGNYGYYERHLKGQQMVFFIRRTGQPNKPYFTAEIDVESGRIRQLYGFGDCSAPKEVRAFVEGFVKSVCRWRNVQTLAS